ncbi:protein ligase RNF165 [Seminavis robusta]|uniref:RING-type E3 ubiquitin transferase n=1 Tax=Seminavis robusta TaxID=568900 RepID=A0A9N8DHA9_9STRA|nr:protein ligase RNF165 [Seminavis robusta]|eukprot:Sro66_g037310.1 protein ligase RNF165 (390) ;mRNA; f:114767-115936
MIPCRQRLVLILATLFAIPLLSEAQVFVRLCVIPQFVPAKAVIRQSNESHDEYSWALDNTAARSNLTAATTTYHNGGLRRQLASSENPVPSIFLPSDHNRHLAEIPNSISSEVYMVRECPCALDHYCPIELDTCGVPASYREPIGCFESSTKKTLLRNAWPLLMLWYSTVMFFLLCTEKGRNARHFILVRCCKSHINERLVDRFLYLHGFSRRNPDADQPERHSQHPLDWLPIARPVEPREPTELVLKTTIYDQASSSDDEACCTICIAPLETGDRVGKLSCTHTFHVDCLREWLPRRNVCPLCQSSDAATPRYAESDDSGDAEEDDNDNHENEINENNPPEDPLALAVPVFVPLEVAQVDEVEENPRPRERGITSGSFAQRLFAVSRI